MSDTRQDEEDIERLLNAAGERRSPPDDTRARVYAAALQAWHELPAGQVQQPRHSARPGQRYLALAATTVIAVALGMLWLTQSVDPRAPVGDVVYAHGGYQLDGAAAGLANPSLQLDSSLQTAAGGIVSLRLAAGAIVTLDQHTEMSIAGPHTLFLRHGRLYADAGGAGQSLVVQTPYAKIVDIGTQFEVSVGGRGAVQSDELIVAVREGQVDVSGAGAAFSAAAADGMGDVVHVRGNTVSQRFRVPTTDARWDWRRAGRAPYALADSTVYSYLQWMARDTGHELDFASRSVEQMSKIGILQGKGSQKSSDDTEITELLSATRFQLHEPSPGRWVVDFRS